MVVDQGVNLADRGAGEVIDTDADEFSSRVGDLVCVVADEGKGCAPLVEPAPDR